VRHSSTLSNTGYTFVTIDLKKLNFGATATERQFVSLSKARDHLLAFHLFLDHAELLR
jgi:hypothetical protein